MQHLQSYKHILGHLLDVLPVEPLLPRRPCHVVIKVLENDSRRLCWIMYFIQDGAQAQTATLQRLRTSRNLLGNYRHLLCR